MTRITRLHDAGRISITGSLAFLLVHAPAVLAHGPAGVAPWQSRLFSWGSFALLFLLRPRRRSYFAAAIVVLLLALVWPLEDLAQHSLAAHMLQHMLIIALAAPLLVAARPALPILKGSKAAGTVIRLLSRPLAAFLLHAAAIWIVHTPAALEAARHYPLVHVLEHAALLGSAVLLWWTLRRGRHDASGAASLWTLATMLHTSILGALLTFAPRLLYPAYTLPDQQLAGLVMWVPGGALYLAAGLSFAAAWLGRMEANS